MSHITIWSYSWVWLFLSLPSPLLEDKLQEGRDLVVSSAAAGASHTPEPDMVNPCRMNACVSACRVMSTHSTRCGHSACLQASVVRGLLPSLPTGFTQPLFVGSCFHGFRSPQKKESGDIKEHLHSVWCMYQETADGYSIKAMGRWQSHEMKRLPGGKKEACLDLNL